LHFKQATVSAMQDKLYQFDEAFRNEIVSFRFRLLYMSSELISTSQSTYSVALYPEEIKLLDETFSYLSQVVASATPSGSPPNAMHVDAIIQILDRWPASQRFPGTTAEMPITEPLTNFLPNSSARPQPSRFRVLPKCIYRPASERAFL
jgi:phospholipase A-2-activating protein